MLKAQVIGNLGAHAERKEINGVAYVSFDVAHKVKNGDSEKTIWVGCLARGHEKVLPYLLKGTKVYVCGDLSCRIYDSSMYHCKMVAYNVFVDTLQLCSPKQEEKSAVQQQQSEQEEKPAVQQQQSEDNPLPPQDDVPF